MMKTLYSPFRSRSFTLLVISIVVLVTITVFELRASLIHKSEGFVTYTASAQLLVVALLLIVAAVSAASRHVQQLEQHFRATFEQSPIGICHAGRDGTFLAVNEAFCKMLGYTRQELIGRSGFDMSHPDDRARTIGLAERVGSGAVPSVSYDRRYIRKDGETVYAHLTLASVRRGGRVDHLLAMAEDITDARRTRDRLNFQARLLDCVQQAIIATDGSGNIVYWNRFAEALYGWSADEAIGRLITETVTAPQHGDQTMSRIGGGESWTGEFEVVSRSGRQFVAHVTDSPIFDDDGLLIGIVGISMDVTEQRRSAELLRNREAQLNLAQQMASLGSWELDYRTGLRQWSEQMFRMLGLQPGDADTAIGMFKNLIVEEDRPEMERLSAEVMTGPATIECEYRIRRATDGEVRLLRSNGRVVRDADGAPLKMFGVSTDITEVRASENDLRRYAEQQTAVAEIGTKALSALHDATIDHACDVISSVIEVDYARFLEYHPATQDLTLRAGHAFGTPAVPATLDTHAGYALLTNQAVAVNDYRADGRFAITQKTMPSMINAGIVVPVRGHHTSFGVISALSTRPRAFSDTDVQFLRAIANILAEAMEREAANRAVVESEARYRALVEGANDIIYTASPEGVTLSLNPAFERITGRKVADWVGKPFLPLIAERDRERAMALFGEILQNHELPPYELVLLGEDGSEISGEATAFAHVEHGEVVEISGFCRDVTQSRQMQTQLEQEKRVASLGRLATSLAHEFNNVLMGISPFVEVLKREIESPRGKAALEHMATSIRRGKGVTGEVLRFARASEPMLAPIDLTAWVSSIVEEGRRMVGAGYRVELHVEDALPLLLGDAHQLHQTMTNLILNARDAMANGGTITIDVRLRETAAIAISVHDHGCGMEAGLIQHIFEPLFTTRKSGTGLGLALAHQVVTRHGGKISVESEPGEGTTFHVVLPLRDEGPIAAAPPPRDPDGATRFRRVLLVEDEPAVAAGLASLLEADGLQVATVGTGAEVENAIDDHRPDVVVLDIGLPDVDGSVVYLDIARKHPKLPVVFSTGHGDRAKLESHLVKPHVGFILKPYSAAALYTVFARLK
jgi:PAS domain S-box-containing protein